MRELGTIKTKEVVMSRRYEMNITVKSVEQEECKVIDEVLQLDGAENDGYYYDNTYNCGYETSLCGGMTEEEFADQISKAIWKALGGYYPIEIRQTCLEYIPCEIHCMEEEEYGRIMEEAVAELIAKDFTPEQD